MYKNSELREEVRDCLLGRKYYSTSLNLNRLLNFIYLLDVSDSLSQCLRNADGASAAHSAHSPVGKLELLGVESVPSIRTDFSLEESRHECINT